MYWIERGVNTPDKGEYGRWAPDLKIAYVTKEYYPDIFKRLVIDCSHSGSRKEFTKDIYKAFKAIGVEHFMFEVYNEVSKTDTKQVLSIDEFKEVIA